MQVEEQFRMIDTKQADGVYVTFERLKFLDETASPHDNLFQDEAYREEDEARLADWNGGDWDYIGIQAKAVILVVESGTGTTYEITSAGLWGIESDSGEEYLNKVFAGECETLKRHIPMMAGAKFE